MTPGGAASGGSHGFAVDVASPDVSDADSPIDWELAERVATRTCGGSDFSRSEAAVTMPAELRALTATAQALVEEFTGLRSQAGEARAEVIDRPAWVRANILGFKHLLDPVAKKLAAIEAERGGGKLVRKPTEWTKSIGRRLLGLELGVLLGFLSQRVLGQYDLLLPEEAAGGAPGGVVYYVGPNIASLEARFGFRSRDFRLWIALHEVTHRTQFTAVPWMRPYFLGMVDESLGSIDPDPHRIFEMLEDLLDRVKHGRSPIPEEGLAGLLATPEQRAVLDRVQALMTLLEGHGNWVMDAIGADHVHGQAQMSAALRQRRQQGGISKLFLRLMGMEMKARQYEEGQRFITAVTERVGRHGIDAAWRGADCLPTIEELRGEPEVWLARVQAP